MTAEWCTAFPLLPYKCICGTRPGALTWGYVSTTVTRKKVMSSIFISPITAVNAGARRTDNCALWFRDPDQPPNELVKVAEVKIGGFDCIGTYPTAFFFSFFEGGCGSVYEN